MLSTSTSYKSLTRAQTQDLILRKHLAQKTGGGVILVVLLGTPARTWFFRRRIPVREFRQQFMI